MNKMVERPAQMPCSIRQGLNDSIFPANQPQRGAVCKMETFSNERCNESHRDRARVARRGRVLEYFTIVWNLIEGLVAVIAGLAAGSISLVGFGIDSFIEVTSGATLLWRMSVDPDVTRRVQNERLALRVVGVCFIALAAFIAYESMCDLIRRKAPEHSIPGIVLACLSLIAMPVLSRAKRKVASALRSAAMHADAKQTDFCVYLSAILLCGLLLNALFGIWWADPVAALVMVPIVTNEGIEAVRGEECDHC